MAEMYRPGQTYYGQGGAKADHPNWFKTEDEAQKQASLYRSSSTDPRLTGEQRLDQRYGNYTYGTDPGYAARQAGSLQQRGTSAQQTLGGQGTAATDRGTQIFGRSTPQTDFREADDALTRQGGIANRLTAFADQGPGPSQAQAQLDASTAASKRFALSQAGAGRGLAGGASATRDAMTQNAITQGQANVNAAAVRAQEEDLYRGRKLQALGAAGDTYSSMAGAHSQNAQFLTEADLRAEAQRDQASLGYSQLGVDATQQGYAADLAYDEAARKEFENEAQAHQAYEGNLTDLASSKMAADAAKAQEEGSGLDTALGVATAAGGIAAMFSDERSKERIRELEDLNDRYAQLVDIRDPYADETAAAHAPASSTTYEYKQPEAPGAGRGRYAGPMAQELEGIPGVVKDTPQGKMVDPGRLTMANTSAIGSLERRQRALEAAGKGGGDDDFDTRYEVLNDKPAPKARPARVDTSAAPSRSVQDALHAFGNYTPTEGDIAIQREAVREKHGSKAANEFERYATALKRERGQQRPGRVDFGPAQIESRGGHDGAVAAQPAGPTTGASVSSGRNIPMRLLDAPTLAPEDEDELMREFYDPSERYRSVAL